MYTSKVSVKLEEDSDLAVIFKFKSVSFSATFCFNKTCKFWEESKSNVLMNFYKIYSWSDFVNGLEDKWNYPKINLGISLGESSTLILVDENLVKFVTTARFGISKMKISRESAIQIFKNVVAKVKEMEEALEQQKLVIDGNGNGNGMITI